MLVATTRGTILKAEITWIIRDILNWPATNTGESLDSPVFHAVNDEGIKWALKIQNDPSVQDSLGLFLHLSECPTSKPTIPARFSIVVSDEQGGTLLYEKKTNVIPMHLSKLSGKNDQFLGNGRLPMGKREEFLKIPLVSIKIHAIVEYEKEQMISSISSLINGGSQKSSWNEDFENLFTTKSGSDISFMIDGQEIKAHKTVLSARSPVYAAMFHSDMKEKGLDRVDVPDNISPDIFNELLRFMYTDQVNLAECNAEPLLVAADKYILPLLKSKCEEFLINHLTTENCIEMLTLADMHNALNLRKMSQELFRTRHIEIRKTAAWRALRISHPVVALDAFERLVD